MSATTFFVLLLHVRGHGGCWLKPGSHARRQLWFSSPAAFQYSWISKYINDNYECAFSNKDRWRHIVDGKYDLTVFRLVGEVNSGRGTVGVEYLNISCSAVWRHNEIKILHLKESSKYYRIPVIVCRKFCLIWSLWKVIYCWMFVAQHYFLCLCVKAKKLKFHYLLIWVCCSPKHI